VLGRARTCTNQDASGRDPAQPGGATDRPLRVAHSQPTTPP
jgi:hypothetical protein